MSVLNELRRIADALAGDTRRGRLLFGIGQVVEQTKKVYPTYTHYSPPKGEILVMLNLTATQKATASVRFVDKKGNPANVDGTPAWGVDNPNVVAITPSDDGLSCEVSAVGPIGSALVSVQADADLGDGITPLAGTLEVSVTAGDAATITIEVSDPVEQE